MSEDVPSRVPLTPDAVSSSDPPLGAEDPPSPASVRGWIARRLLPWFASNQRSLPWRRNRDPYPIWVSEIMLQQTQVATVVAYFERFLAAFPTVCDLARADEADVLKLWEGLGYYRRARMMHRTAQLLVEQHNGKFPDEEGLLESYPGMGRYTRNAVLSQAFDRRLPILEANSERVLCRLFGRREDPKRPPLRNWLWETAAAILPQQQAGNFNQALMELGALICTPANPACQQCPLRNKCHAHRTGSQNSIPARTAPKEATRIDEVAAVVWKDDRVFVGRRPASGRWGNLWEFPHGPLHPGETHEQAVTRILRETTGIGGRAGKELITIRHTVTRFAITMTCLEMTYLEGEFANRFYSRGAWVLPGELAEYPVSSPQRILAHFLTKPGRQQLLF